MSKGQDVGMSNLKRDKLRPAGSRERQAKSSHPLRAARRQRLPNAALARLNQTTHVLTCSPFACCTLTAAGYIPMEPGDARCPASSAGTPGASL